MRTAALELLQTTCVLRSCVLPSEKVPIAVNCCVVPSGRLGLAGVIAIETRVAGTTVTDWVEAVCPPTVAVTWTEPAARPVARPALERLTTLELELEKVDELVRFCVEPSE